MRIDPSRLKRARSISYDPARRAIVVTMAAFPYEGKSFGFFAEDRDGAPGWTCRAIDIDTKYLPAGCRHAPSLKMRS